MAERTVGLSVDGLTELLGGLKAAQQSLGKEQRRANKEVAAQVVAWAQSSARSGTRQQAAAASAIVARSTQTLARLGFNNSVPFSRAAFFGMKQRTGWYARGRYANSTGRQAPPWVGNNWIPGRPGEGPYVINATLAERVDEIGEMYLDAHMRALKAAFPGGPE